MALQCIGRRVPWMVSGGGNVAVAPRIATSTRTLVLFGYSSLGRGGLVKAVLDARSRREISAVAWRGIPREATLSAMRRLDGSTTFRRYLFNNGVNQTLLANLEAAANRSPGSATAQNLFYQALARANMPAIIVERYQTRQYATNAACDSVYQKAVASFGGQVNTSTGGAAASAMTGQTQANTAMGFTPAQMQALAQAVAANSHGASMATRVPPANGSSSLGTSDAPLQFQVTESWRLLIFKYVRFLVTFAVFTYLSILMVNVIIENISTFKKLGGGKPQNEAQAEQQKARFSDVHGCDEAKDELQELVQFLKDPAKFSTLGGKLPKGVLLVGPPGTGKTLLARAVAGEAGVPFFFMSGSEFDEVFVGVGAKRIRDLFKSAREKSPAIVFIDELDAIGGKRNPRDGAYAKQTLNQLLTELDGFQQDSGVIILAATNFPEALDKALTRPGRFDRNVVVPLPDVRGRIAILKHHMKKMTFAKDVVVTEIAQATSGLSGADLENLVNQAAVRASRAKASAISKKHLEWARDKVLMGSERKSMIMSQKEKELTAYHEAGHALICMYNPLTDPLYKVTIMPRGEALGLTMHLPAMDKYSKGLVEYQASVDICMGGKVAEEIRFGADNVTSGCSGDINAATRIAYDMVARHGMSEALGNVDLATNYNSLSTRTRELIEVEVRRIIEDGRQRAMDLLTAHRKELDLLAQALLKYETLDREEAFKVVRGETLDDKVAVSPEVPTKVPATSPTPASGEALPDIPGRPVQDSGRPPPAIGGVAA